MRPGGESPQNSSRGPVDGRSDPALRAMVRVAIRDDGVGGADPAHGSGLVGLSDRIEALGGTFEVTSPAGDGTTLLIKIPTATVGVHDRS